MYFVPQQRGRVVSDADELFAVRDKVVLVSGGSRGIGQALAEGFARRDARVVITGRDADTLKETAVKISTGKHAVDFVVCDVSKPETVTPMVQEVVAKAGRVDSLLNVAGVNIRKRV